MELYDYCNERCPDCPGNTPIIAGDGPSRSRVLFIGESPGLTDGEESRPLHGKAGREFNDHYLRLAGLHRNSVYVTNTVKCHVTKGDTKPTPDLVRSCSSFHLRAEISNIRPELIVTMGAIANNLVKGGMDLMLEHGIPRIGSIMKYETTILPMIHPSSGMHDGKNIIHLRNDFRTLKAVLNESYRPVRDKYPNPDAVHLTRPADLEEIFETGTNIAIDTESASVSQRTVIDGHEVESSAWKPWCLTFAQGPYTGYLILFEDKRMMKVFSRLMAQHKAIITMQNHSYDVPILENEGVPIVMKRVRDTMMRAFHLGGGMPQGLKAMSYRVLGSRMLDFDDLVKPYWRKYAKKYLEDIAKIKWPKEAPQEITQEDGTVKIYNPQNLNTKLKRLFTDLRKGGEPNKIFERYHSWPDSQKLAATAANGPYPRPSVTLCPFEIVLKYACHDAVNTWRLGEDLFARRVSLDEYRAA